MPATRGPDASPALEQAFGSVLRALRAERGISQERLGHEAESGRTYVSQLERGERGPSLRTVFRLAPLLGVTASEFVRRVEEAMLTPNLDPPSG